MRRIQEKIKDFVEAKSFEVVENYAADLRRALAAYLFTDATADLLARWLDALADMPRTQGATHALAGMRGVGKSHLLAAFGALAAYPDLRGTIVEPHVAASVRRLLNRRYQVVFVERGTRSTLLEELSAALAHFLQVDESQWAGQSPEAMLAIAASRSDAPLVLIIDTAPGREARVRRDDGPLLAQLAAATKALNVFIALALDDDIAGAEGVNSALAGAYRIDYLDSEHLYRITDVHLFQKNDQARAALHDIYVQLRGVVAGFNWSEPRFMAIYPVHPLVADVAPAVRLYAQSFAFLPFAANAGSRAVNRPAMSLVVLDDVFDRAEYDLRQAEELSEAFAAYDVLTNEAVAQIPVMQRLQAKLVLKGLFILSLDGRGATAREICAAMLLFDEGQPDAAIVRVAEMLQRFAAAAPEKSFRVSEDGGETRYRFHIRASAGFEEALLERTAAAELDPAALEYLWQTLARQRFADWPLLDDENRLKPHSDVLIHWRGLGRQVLLSWHAPDADGNINVTPVPRDETTWPFDWEVALLAPLHGEATDGSVAPKNHDADTLALWRPATLTTEELETLRRLLMLRAQPALFQEFGEAARAAERTHAALAERIWTRLYLDDGALVMGWAEFTFTEDAKAAKTLDQSLSGMLAPLLGARYPQHPIFLQNLGENDVAQLVGGLFSGATPNEEEVQELARLFAAPLGLTTLRGQTYALETGDQALKQPWIREIISLTDAADGQVVPFETVYQKLRGEPYGLLRRVQHLVLAALVAQRRIDLVTTTGDRIGRRTLDLRIRWDDIAGVARVESLLYTAEELTAWAALLTSAPKLPVINTPEARQRMRAALKQWLDEWREGGLLERFDALPDESLTTRLWHVAVAVRKSYGMAADALAETLEDRLTLEEGLQRVADAFANSTKTFERYAGQRAQLESFVKEWPQFAAVGEYVAQTEPLADAELEALHAELNTLTTDVHTLSRPAALARLHDLWAVFHQRYCEVYAREHEKAAGAAPHLRALNEILHSDRWNTFAALARLPLFSRDPWQAAQARLAEWRHEPCRWPVRESLMKSPVCACGFRLAEAGSWQNAPETVKKLLDDGLNNYYQVLAAWSRPLAYALEAFIADFPDVPLADAARTLSDQLVVGQMPEQLSFADVQLLETILQRHDAPPLRVQWPHTNGATTRDELAAQVKQWLDALPDAPATLEVVAAQA